MADEPEYRRRLEDKLADEEREKEPPIPGLEELPLRARPVKVARFNRRLVGALLVLIAIVTAASLIYSLTPGREKTK